MFKVNPKYRYTETDINCIAKALIIAKGLTFSTNGTVLNADGSTYLLKDSSFTLASDQAFNASSATMGPKLLKLEISIQESLAKSKGISRHIVLFPLHQHGNHWTLIMLAFTKNRVLEIASFDPLHSLIPVDNLRVKLGKILRKYIKPDPVDFSKNLLPSLMNALINSAHSYPVMEYCCRSQTDANSCGPHIVNYIFELIINGNVAQGPQYSMEETIVLRQQHLDILNDPEFAQQQLINAPDVTLKPKYDPGFNDWDTFVDFKDYLASLTIEQNVYFNSIANQFVACETALEAINNPRLPTLKTPSLDLDTDAIIAAASIKIWFMEHQAILSAKNVMQKIFKPQQPDAEIQWQEQQADGTKNGKDVLLGILQRLTLIKKSTKDSQTSAPSKYVLNFV